MDKIIITGSKGLIGTEVTKFFKQTHEVLELDLQLGHDLNDESFVKEWFSKNKGSYLLNLFGMNDHVDKDKKEFSNLFNISLSSFKDYLDVNLVSLFSVCREFARNNETGAIVNFSGLYGVVSPIPQMFPENKKHVGYCVSKAGVVLLTRYLATHFAPKIRVNCLVPGGVLHRQSEEFLTGYASHTPMGRMMNVSELNGILEYLCSEKSSYVTGSIFTIDGGWTAL